jgi:hypothetical protein
MKPIEDKFRGLNLLDDPTEILPGESVVCENLYIKGNSLVNRPSDTLLWTLSENVVSIKVFKQVRQENAEMIILTEAGGNDAKVYHSTLTDGEWSDPLYQITLEGILENLDQVVWLEAESELYVVNGSVVWYYDPVTETWTNFSAGTGSGGINIDPGDFDLWYPRNTFVQYTPVMLNPGEDDALVLNGYVRYIYQLIDSTTGFTFFMNCPLPFPKNAAGQTIIPPYGHVWDVRKEDDVTTLQPFGSYESITAICVNGPQPPAPYPQFDRVKVWRRRQLATSPLLPGIWEDAYYLVRNNALGEDDFPYVNGQFAIFDDENTDAETSSITLTDEDLEGSETATIPPDVVDAQWFQNRVIWSSKRGTCTISKYGEPFSANASLTNIQVTSSENLEITNTINYLGTFIFFTEDGIYHLVGAISDDVTESKHQFYKAFDLRCLKTRNILNTANQIYFVSEDGFSMYDTRQVLLLSDKIRSLWEGVDQDDISSMTIVPEKGKRLILFAAPDKTAYVYHYEKQFTESNPGPGTWTTWEGTGSGDHGWFSAPQREGGGLKKAFIAYYFAGRRIFSLDGSEGVAWLWESGELTGGAPSIPKNWKEIRVTIEGDYGLFIRNEQDEVFGYDLVYYSDQIAGVRYGPRAQLKRQGKYIQLKVGKYSGGIRLTDFSLSAHLMGV